ncbi:hypothetical protein [Sphingomonas endophytica]|uniref:Uncharacterized protein n=1 Tax=Sphingomonas endophytica TaxID=869719 RepID=A0A147I3N6_9SPHN|nr:hypothetical protein [Sphingomonas endophytica]KTT72609.1 hypothetical protein NS334_08420 [Sphingomonas endophytica]
MTDLIPRLRDWIPHAVTALGVVYASGQSTSRQQETARQVEKLEERADRNDERAVEFVRLAERIDGKVERVDGKLTMLIERTTAHP